MRSICFLTSLNLVSNPRIVKEIELAHHAGMAVQVVCFRFRNNSDVRDQILVSQVQRMGVVVYQLEYSKSKFWSWLVIQFAFQVIRLVYRITKAQRLGRILAGGKVGVYLHQQVKHLSLQSSTWIIAHNPGAFLAGCTLAAKWPSAQLGIDVEDYHPGESANAHQQAEITFLLQYAMQQASYVSFASKPIEDRCRKLLPTLGEKSVGVIPNAFPRAEFIAPATRLNQPGIRAVWFSQHISFGRGLEALLACIAEHRLPIRVTLIGNLHQDFWVQVLSQYDFVDVLPPLLQSELHRALGSYDLGLAIEPGKDENNALALSNKLFAYVQAGLYVVVSDTPGHRSFMDNQPELGYVTSLHPSKLSVALHYCVDHIDSIRAKHQERYVRAEQFSWECYTDALLHRWMMISDDTRRG